MSEHELSLIRGLGWKNREHAAAFFVRADGEWIEVEVGLELWSRCLKRDVRPHTAWTEPTPGEAYDAVERLALAALDRGERPHANLLIVRQRS